jgi:5'-deoxynucleotidase YfbR-like HD superfamily hydrolase
MLYKADAQAVDTSPEFELALLLHDAAEAYVGDMLHMTKKLESLAGYRLLEDNVSRIIYQRFGLDPLRLETDFPGIKRYDQQAAHVEFVKLIPAATDLAQLAKQYEMDMYPPLIKAKVPDFVEFLKDRAINAGVTDVAALFERPESLVPYLDEAPASHRSDEPVERVEPLHSVADVEDMHL